MDNFIDCEHGIVFWKYCEPFVNHNIELFDTVEYWVKYEAGDIEDLGMGRTRTISCRTIRKHSYTIRKVDYDARKAEISLLQKEFLANTNTYAGPFNWMPRTEKETNKINSSL